MKDFVTNYDVDQLLQSNEKIAEMLKAMVDVKPGSGSVEIHTYALRVLLMEIAYLRALEKKS